IFSQTRLRFRHPMLVIREAQLRAFEAARHSALARRLVIFLQERHAAGDDPEALRAKVETGIQRAARHGLKDDASVALFVALMFEFAPNFDQHPRVRELLRGTSAPPAVRLRRVVGSIAESEWSEIRAAADASAWRR